MLGAVLKCTVTRSEHCSLHLPMCLESVDDRLFHGSHARYAWRTARGLRWPVQTSATALRITNLIYILIGRSATIRSPSNLGLLQHGVPRRQHAELVPRVRCSSEACHRRMDAFDKNAHYSWSLSSSLQAGINRYGILREPL